MSKDVSIGMIAYPNMTNLDFAGPFEFFAKIPNCTVHIVWKSTDLILSDTRAVTRPTTAFSSCPPIDVLFVPGGPGQVDLMDDQEVLGFLAERGATAKWVTSVCTGSLLLGAAGLLQGYKATSHWMSLDLLPIFGAIASSDRVVRDRNRITGGGVTAGIDFGLELVAEIAGKEMGQRFELGLEYAPHPPFGTGTPQIAPPDIVEKVLARAAPLLEKRKAGCLKAAERLACSQPPSASPHDKRD